MQAFQVIKLFLGKLERLSEDPLAAEQQQKIEGEAQLWDAIITRYKK